MKQRIVLLVLAAALVVFVSACTASLVNTPGSDESTIALHTPAANLTPTPTAPPYTIGVFSSNETPNVNDSVTVYVIFHLGDKPVGGATVVLNFFYRDPTNNPNNLVPASQLNSQVSPQQTAPDGWAAFPLTFTGLKSQLVVLANVTVSYNGQTYVRQGEDIAYIFTAVQPSPTPSPKPGG